MATNICPLRNAFLLLHMLKFMRFAPLLERRDTKYHKRKALLSRREKQKN